MSFYQALFSKYSLRPSVKYSFNLFFLRDSLSLTFKTLLYPYFFYNLKSKFKIKVLKTNNINIYSFYRNTLIVTSLLLSIIYIVI